MLPTSNAEFIKFFSTSDFTPDIIRWKSKREAAYYVRDTLTLNVIMLDARKYLTREPGFPDPDNRPAFINHLVNSMRYEPFDVDLMDVFITGYMFAREQLGIARPDSLSDPRTEYILNNDANLRSVGEDDDSLNLKCGVRAVFTLGLEPLLNDNSPCRTVDRNPRGTVDVAIGGIKKSTEIATETVVGAGEGVAAGFFAGIYNGVGWGTLLVVGIVAVIGAAYVVTAKKVAT